MASIVCPGGTRVTNPRRSDFRGNTISSLERPICIVPATGGWQRRSAPRLVLAMAKYKGTLMREKKLTEMIESKVKEATEVCEGDRTSDECKVAWDEVEEVSQAMADLRRKLNQHQDPLESYCVENPETDECRIYEE